jgi:hypothetical protein
MAESRAAQEAALRAVAGWLDREAGFERPRFAARLAGLALLAREAADRVIDGDPPEWFSTEPPF